MELCVLVPFLIYTKRFLGHVLDLLQVFEFRTMKQLEIHGGENRPQCPSQFPLTGSLAFRETCPLITARAELVLSLLGKQNGGN